MAARKIARRPYRMTSKRRVALRKAQLASARARKRAGSHISRNRKKYTRVAIAATATGVTAAASYKVYDHRNPALYHGTYRHKAKTIARTRQWKGMPFDHPVDGGAGRMRGFDYATGTGSPKIQYNENVYFFTKDRVRRAKTGKKKDALYTYGTTVVKVRVPRKIYKQHFYSDDTERDAVYAEAKHVNGRKVKILRRNKSRKMRNSGHRPVERNSSGWH